jgi:Fe(II)/alpha-ketoglutarate-dependent arginine beta-hydroxylase
MIWSFNRLKKTATMNILELNAEENQQISILLSSLLEQYHVPSDDTFLLEARIIANKLPGSIVKKLNDFRYSEDHNGTFMLRGFYIDDEEIGATPFMTSKELDESSALREGFMLMLLVSLLGDAMAWSSQRNGALINNILPVKGDETEQLSTGSLADLDWHTEEAFHPFRADYLTLMCLRNPDRIPTLIGSVKDVEVDPLTKKILFESRFIFGTDNNFKNGAAAKSIDPEPVFFGNFDTPYVKIDPAFMQTLPGDKAAETALAMITEQFSNALTEIVLLQGDVLFIDNYRVVHGRKGFQPRFDGTDRWLKRVNITTDLRKSRSMRKHQHSRVIITN